MKLKISTPQEIVYQGEVKTITIPTETGELHIDENQHPLVVNLKSGILLIKGFDNKEIRISISKWTGFVDGNIIRIVTPEATKHVTIPKEQLQQEKSSLEQRIKSLRSKASIEEIDHYVNKLTKINSDLTLMNRQLA